MPESALPKRSDADEGHEYPEKDRADGIRAPLVLIEATELESCGLRQVYGARGVQGCIRGHRNSNRSVKGVFVSGLRGFGCIWRSNRTVGAVRNICR